jgi:hypothetical protein
MSGDWLPGKRTRQWNSIRAKIKPKFEAAGITRCEFKYSGCFGGVMLSFAHGKKRRNLTVEELEKLVALACINCHTILELKPEEEMEKAVREVIKKRTCQP